VSSYNRILGGKFGLSTLQLRLSPPTQDPLLVLTYVARIVTNVALDIRVVGRAKIRSNQVHHCEGLLFWCSTTEEKERLDVQIEASHMIKLT
jgi:hypothetical protein